MLAAAAGRAILPTSLDCFGFVISRINRSEGMSVDGLPVVRYSKLPTCTNSLMPRPSGSRIVVVGCCRSARSTAAKLGWQPNGVQPMPPRKAVACYPRVPLITTSVVLKSGVLRWLTTVGWVGFWTLKSQSPPSASVMRAKLAFTSMVSA